MSKPTEKSAGELEPRHFNSFLGGDIKFDHIEAKQKADKHGNPVKVVKFEFSGSFDLKNNNDDVIDTVDIKLSLKTGPEGMNRIKEITEIYAIHQYAKFALLPSEYQDMDLSKEILKQNTLDSFFSVEKSK